MSDVHKKAIFQFVKKAHDEQTLKDTVQQDDFADLLFEVYKSVKPNESVKARVKFIKNELKDEDSIEASDFIQTNVDGYIERMVKFVDQQTTKGDRNRSRSRSNSRRSDKEDPLERNNLKADSSGSSDEEDRNHNRHRLPLKKSKKDSRDYRNRDDDRRDGGKDRRQQQQNKKYPNNNNKKPFGLNIPSLNLLMMNMQNQLGQNGGQLSLPELFNQIRPNQEFRNRKDTVFLVNLPREFRSLAEIGEIFKNKGAINNVNLAGRVPSVQFKKFQDAQNLINVDKFIVHKGIKVELSSTPATVRNPRQQRRPNQGDEIRKEESKVEAAEAEKKVDEPQQPAEIQESQDDLTKKRDQLKLERDAQKQIEHLKSSINTVLAERLRTLLFLSKRDYPSDIKAELEERKKQSIVTNKQSQLKPMKEAVKTVDNLEQLKHTYQGLLELLDHSLIVKNIPAELFTQKTVMKVLTDHFQQFGTIESLQLRLKEQTAQIKFFSFESAEKTFQTASAYTLEFQHQSIMRYLKQ